MPRSITPSTFRGRVPLEEGVAKETYAFGISTTERSGSGVASSTGSASSVVTKLNEVIRFAIDPSASEAAVVATHALAATAVADASVSALASPVTSVASLGLAAAGTRASQVDARSETSGRSRPSDLDKVKAIVHHDAEIKALNTAIKYLFESAERKTVLVDIFERNDDNSLKPTTHTVVLYKNDSAAQEVVVIDPSNFTFSSHLSTDNSDILSRLNLPVKITTFHKKDVQIYKPVGEPGFAPLYRNCVDIAVKIAFGLNESEAVKFTSIKSITGHPSIIAISNNHVIDTNIIVNSGSVRVKQASDLDVVKIYSELEKAVFEGISELEFISPDRAESKIEEYKLLLRSADSFECFRLIAGFNRALMSCSETSLSVQHEIKSDFISELLGMGADHE